MQIAVNVSFALTFVRQIDKKYTSIRNEAQYFSRTRINCFHEADFHLYRQVNKQYYRFWATKQPRITHEEPFYLLKVTLWCGVYVWGVIGSYFFLENAAGQTNTVKVERYRAMFTEFLIPQLDKLEPENIWFQQDGTTYNRNSA